MQVAGRIKMIGMTEQPSATFAKRDIVITTEEQYPQHISIQFVNDKCLLLDQFQVGQLVQIGINLRGREWVNPQGETKYFNTIQGWRIDAQQQSQQIPQQGYGAPQPQQQGYGQPQQPQYHHPQYAQPQQPHNPYPMPGQQPQQPQQPQPGHGQQPPQQPNGNFNGGYGNPSQNFPPAPVFGNEDPDDLPF